MQHILAQPQMFLKDQFEHAAQRFLERVIKKVDFTKYEVHRTVEYLEKVLSEVSLNSYAKPFALRLLIHIQVFPATLFKVSLN